MTLSWKAVLVHSWSKAVSVACLTVISLPVFKLALAASVWPCCCVKMTVFIRAWCTSASTPSLPSSSANRWTQDGIKRLTVNPSSILRRCWNEKENSLWLELWIQLQPACLIYRASCQLPLQLLNYMNQTCDAPKPITCTQPWNFNTGAADIGPGISAMQDQYPPLALTKAIFSRFRLKLKAVSWFFNVIYYTKRKETASCKCWCGIAQKIYHITENRPEILFLRLLMFQTNVHLG